MYMFLKHISVQLDLWRKKLSVSQNLNKLTGVNTHPVYSDELPAWFHEAEGTTQRSLGFLASVSTCWNSSIIHWNVSAFLKKKCSWRLRSNVFKVCCSCCSRLDSDEQRACFCPQNYPYNTTRTNFTRSHLLFTYIRTVSKVWSEDCNRPCWGSPGSSCSGLWLILEVINTVLHYENEGPGFRFAVWLILTFCWEKFGWFFWKHNIT